MQLTSPPRRYIQEGTTAKVVTVSLSNLRKPGDTGAIPALDNMRQFFKTFVVVPNRTVLVGETFKNAFFEEWVHISNAFSEGPNAEQFQEGKKGGGEPDEQ